MLSRFNLWCRDRILTLKRIINRNRAHFYIAFACLIIGFIIAVTKSYENFDKCTNFISAIKAGEFKAFLSILWIVLFTTLSYLFVLIASYRFFLFLIFGYGGLVLGSYLLWRYAFIQIASCGFFGILYTVIFILPVFVVNAFLLILSLAKVYDIAGYSHNKKCKVSLMCHATVILKIIRKSYFYALIFNFCWWAFLSIIFAIIF